MAINAAWIEIVFLNFFVLIIKIQINIKLFFLKKSKIKK
jgi:hypothetical protein